MNGFSNLNEINLSGLSNLTSIGDDFMNFCESLKTIFLNKNNKYDELTKEILNFKNDIITYN